MSTSFSTYGSSIVNKRWHALRDLAGTDETSIVQGTSYRTASVHSTLRRARKLKTALGVTRIAELTELDRLGVPVFAAVRPEVSQFQITAAQGKGVSVAQALASAMLEAVERHAAAHYSKLTISSIEELRLRGLDALTPEMLGGRSLDSAAQIEWVEAIRLRTNSRVLVPAADVVYPYVAPRHIARPFRPSTTGLAAGNSTNEAVLHALFEVIERDAVSRCFVSDWPTLVDTRSIVDQVLVGLVDRIEGSGIELAILDLSGFAVVPTFKVIGLDPMWQGPQMIVTGQGAHIDCRIALRRAVLEFVQSRAVAIQGSREDLSRYQRDWKVDNADARFQFELIRHTALQKGLSSPRKTVRPVGGITKALRLVCSRLLKAGYIDVLYTDLTHDEIQIPVVRVIVPGMVDSFIDPSRKPKCSDIVVCL